MNKILRFSLIPLVIVILIALLFASSAIPKEMIRDNAAKSAKYISEKELFYSIDPKMQNTILHYYADDISLNIAYHINPDNIIESTLRCSYYVKGFSLPNEDVYNSVINDLDANTDYMRYWHGYLLVLRPLLTIMDMQSIYICLTIILIVLFIALGNILLNHGCNKEVIMLIVAAIATNVFIVSFCLEYYWCFLLMIVFSLIVLSLEIEGKTYWLIEIFAVCGIATNFFDFFTNETLTYTVPMTLLFLLRSKKNLLVKKDIVFCFKCAVSWFCGYAGMWILKWLLNILVLGASPKTFMLSNLKKWSVGNSQTKSLFMTMLSALKNNITKIFPIVIPTIGWILTASIFVVLVYRVYVHRNNQFDHILVGLLISISAVPYIRYIVLSPHSSGHSFFTYRAQFATVLALCAIICELTKSKQHFNLKQIKRGKTK